MIKQGKNQDAQETNKQTRQIFPEELFIMYFSGVLLEDSLLND